MRRIFAVFALGAPLGALSGVLRRFPRFGDALVGKNKKTQHGAILEFVLYAVDIV